MAEERDVPSVLRAAADYADRLAGADAMTRACLIAVIGNLMSAVAGALGDDNGIARIWFRCMLCGKAEEEMIRQGEGYLCPSCHARVTMINSGMGLSIA